MRLTPDRSLVLHTRRDIGWPPIRVGIAFDSPKPAHWAEELIDFFRTLSAVEIVAYTVRADRVSDRSERSYLAHWLYVITQPKANPFKPTLGDRKQRSWESAEAGRCDVIIWLASSTDAALQSTTMPANGIFTVTFGNRPQDIPFWDEVSTAEFTSTTTIFWHDTSLAVGRPIRKLETSTSQGLDISSNYEAPLSGVIRLLAGLCLDLQQDRTACIDRMQVVPAVSTVAFPRGAFPSAAKMGRFVTRRLLRSARLRLTARRIQPGWFIAVRRNTGNSIIDSNVRDAIGFLELPLVAGSAQMADPFLYETGGRTYLLFEDIPIGSTRGRIGCVEIFADGRYSDFTVILECDYHLSYPCVFDSEGATYMIPESSEAKRVDLYRFARFPSIPVLVATLLDGLALVDTTPIMVNGLWYFFTTTEQPFVESLLFWSTRLDGPWKLHPASPISCSVRNSRGAGKLFWNGGRLYRPTQDGSKRYGYAITVNEVTQLTSTEFAETQVAWLPPAWSPGLLGTHTWGESRLLQAVDGARLVRAS